MFANRTNRTTQLAAVTKQSSIDVLGGLGFPLPGEAEFPGPPAMPSALLRLELSLSAFVIDLRDITDIIRSDVGLTVQLLRLAATETDQSSGKIGAINEIAVQVGVDGLEALVVQTKSLPHLFSTHTGISACERFWLHSRLTALIAEELASRSSEVSPEEAYLAGLLCHVGELSSVLGLAPPSPSPADSRHIGYRMAKAWGLPGALADVIGGYREICRSPESRALLDIAEAADNWASRLECLAVHCAT